MREHIEMMMERAWRAITASSRVLHLNLLDVAMAYLKQRGLFDKALKMQATKGDAAVLQGTARAHWRPRRSATSSPPSTGRRKHDLLLLSGVGSVWPHAARPQPAQCLHTVMGETPLVMFYPGSFDGTTLRLFGRISHETASKPGNKPLLSRLHFDTREGQAHEDPRDLFERDIHRPINGVVKADQLDASSVWQELDEFVVTRELTRHINDLVAVLLSTMRNPRPTRPARTASGSPASSAAASPTSSRCSPTCSRTSEHSAQRRAPPGRRLLRRQARRRDALRRPEARSWPPPPTPSSSTSTARPITAPGATRCCRCSSRCSTRSRATAATIPTSPTWSATSTRRASWKPSTPPSSVQSGEPWLQERDAWEFHRDEVVAALREALGQSEGSVEKWVDSGERQLQPDRRELRQVGEALPRQPGAGPPHHVSGR